ncbi:MAG: hypothetical protein ABSF26_05965 [Thermoguttaceae bacterium]|jgi:hypothetical protein
MSGKKYQRRFTVAEAADFGPDIRSALALLAKAHDYACRTDADAWEFSIEIERLLARGLETSDLRWLVRMGYLEHAREITQPADAERRFQTTANNAFTKKTCFVLTEAGLLVARARVAKPALVVAAAAGGPTPADRDSIPDWDRERHILSVGDRVVKRYRHPSANQRRILDAFQEERWVHRIDDPLPYLPECEAKERLHSTINRLNRNQQQPLIHFFGDGTGQAFCWELAEAGSSFRPAKANSTKLRAAA